MKKLKKLILNHLPRFFTDYLCEYSKNPETLEILSERKEWIVKYNVALNPYASIETLKKLATDRDMYVRYASTRNPNATEEVLLSRMAHISFYRGKLKRLSYL
jgi:hypothetical protein